MLGMCTSLSPTPEEPGTIGWHNLSIQGPSSLFAVLKTNPGDPSIIAVVCWKGYGEFVCPVNPYIDPVRSTHCGDQSLPSSRCCEQEPSQEDDDVETELWGRVRQGKATDTEAMTRGHKVK